MFAEPVPWSDELKALVQVASDYVVEQRLSNVISHIGEPSMPRDMGKVIGLLAKDALDDFLKEHESAYAALEKSEQRLLNKELNKMASQTVKAVYFTRSYNQ